MKSSDTQLKARGFLDDVELTRFQSCSFEQLWELLDAKDPVARSGAARLLPLTNETTKKLLQTVQQEKKLYCRLEMMRKLESGDQETARMMLPYLGKIGRNQHNIPLTKPSAKKSFPLPRDLIARSLGNMSPEILPILFGQLDVLPDAELSELIDAIGQLLFYHPEAVKEEHFQQLKQLWQQTESPLIQWKLVVCFSALPQSRELLETIAASMPTLAAEAQRALTILSQRRMQK